MTREMKLAGVIVSIVAGGGFVLAFALLVLDRIFYTGPNPGISWEFYFVCCGFVGAGLAGWIYHESTKPTN